MKRFKIRARRSHVMVKRLKQFDLPNPTFWFRSSSVGLLAFDTWMWRVETADGLCWYVYIYIYICREREREVRLPNQKGIRNMSWSDLWWKRVFEATFDAMLLSWPSGQSSACTWFHHIREDAFSAKLQSTIQWISPPIRIRSCFIWL